MTAETLSPQEDPIRYAVYNEDVETLASALFDIDLYPTQAEIVKDIAFKKQRRLILNTYTRYGKTYSVGIGLALYLIFNNDKDLRVGILGAQKSDATRLRKDMLKAGLNSPMFTEMVDSSGGRDPEDLLKKSRGDEMTFCDGSIELKCLSAQSSSSHGDQAGSGQGSGLMGEGFDILILEESTQIDHQTWKSYANRLLEKIDSVLIELGNPWHKDNQFYRHWNSSEFKKYHVTEKDGIEEGRHSREWFDEKARELGGRDTLEYKVLYKAEFPDQIENALIRHSWVEAAKEKQFDFDFPNIYYGLDVADEGRDKTVLTRLEEEDGNYRLTHQYVLSDSGDTGRTADWAENCMLENDEQSEIDRVVVDYVGVGAGVWSKLNEKAINPVKFKAGERPESEGDRFQNKKARNFFKLRDVFQDGDIEISTSICGKLVNQLTHLKTRRRSRDRVEVKDPDSGSPDFADSLMMAVYSGGESWIL
ncbi:MAG: hypothetical protein ABEJ56_00020 [Candidatus Nanohaloarchaea archaeon]